MKTQLTIILICLFSVKPCLVLAENSYSPAPYYMYMGIEYGVSLYKDNSADFSINNVSGMASEDTVSQNYKITLGFNPSRYFAVEMQYADMGKVIISGNAGDSFTRSGVVTTFTADNSELINHYKALYLNGVLKANFVSSALYGKLGLSVMWNDYAIYSAGVRTDSGKYVNWVALRGAGYEYDFSPRVTGRIEYDEIDLGVRKVRLISGGIMLNF